MAAVRGSGMHAWKAVFWSFFGIRKRADLESDAAQLKPVQLITVGLFCAAALVLALVGLVRLVIHYAGG